MAQQGTHLKKLQAKIFRGGNGDSDGDDKATKTSPDSPAPPAPAGGLTINIPNPVLTGTTQNGPDPPKMPTEQPATKQSEPNTDTRPFRQRIAEKLGAEYHGAERFRLDQDNRKEHHWKRWGPYLSDRQWVRRVCSFSATNARDASR